MAASVLLHGLIAAALIAYLEYAPHPDVLATLDLSSVELSFAEEEAETAAVAALPQDEKKPSEEKPVEEKPAEEKTETPVHHEPEEAERLEPREDVRPQTEDVKEKDVRQETKDEARGEKETRDEAKEVRPMPAPKQARLDAPPRPKRNIRPDYPKGARQRGEQGEVVLEIRVNAEGSVDDVKVAVSSGFAELDDAAVRAAKAAKFSPARSGRERVASTARLKLQFKLR